MRNLQDLMELKVKVEETNFTGVFSYDHWIKCGKICSVLNFLKNNRFVVGIFKMNGRLIINHLIDK